MTFFFSIYIQIQWEFVSFSSRRAKPILLHDNVTDNEHKVNSYFIFIYDVSVSYYKLKIKLQ